MCCAVSIAELGHNDASTLILKIVYQELILAVYYVSYLDLGAAKFFVILLRII
jgi:hypothetical protein